MSERTASAIYHASLWHSNQFRKNPINGFKMPYIVHPMDVLKLVWLWGAANELTGPASVLHDVREDAGVQHEGLVTLYGEEVANLVGELTHEPILMSKEAYIDSFKYPDAKSVNALVIKLADRICNVRDFMVDNMGYARKYMVKANPLDEALVLRQPEIINAFGLEVYDRILWDWSRLRNYLLNREETVCAPF